jgi:hypothetical protein
VPSAQVPLAGKTPKPEEVAATKAEGRSRK